MSSRSSPPLHPSSPPSRGRGKKARAASSRRQTMPATPSPRPIPTVPRAHDEAITPSHSATSSPSSSSSSSSSPSPSHTPAMAIPASAAGSRSLMRGPSILAARIASPRQAPSSRHPPQSLAPLPPVSDEDESDSSRPLSLTSMAVDSLISQATNSPPLISPPFHNPPPISALSSSLRAHSLMKSGLMEQKDGPQLHIDGEDDTKQPQPQQQHRERVTITSYAAVEPAARMHPSLNGRSHHSSSHSSSQLSSMSSSPGGLTPMSSSPTSTSPYPSPAGSPTLPPPSLPRPIPGAPQPEVVLPAAHALTALSSSAPVSSVYLSDHPEQGEAVAEPSSHRRSNHPRHSQSSHHVQHHQLLAKSKVEARPSKEHVVVGISSISSLISPANHSSGGGGAEPFKRSRRLSQSSTDSPRLKASPSSSPTEVEQMVYVTNASEFGYPGYESLASHESLDYHTIHNELLRAELSSLTDFDYIYDNVQRWCVTMLIGALIGLIGFASHYGIERISELKFGLVESYLRTDWRVAYAIYSAFNLGLVLVGTVLIVYFCPAACGSGIPEVKGFLNGTAISKALNIKTFLVKLVAAITAVSSSLPVGPEGPMIHMGAMVGGGISQPRSKTLNVSLPWFQKFHTDRDRRDFIAMGAAAGVASAFGAPLGGVLFAIEEASSFWSQMLTWRTFFACMTATFVTNFLLSGVQGNWGVYDFSQVTEFDVSGTGNDSYAIWELLPFALMGALSGLSGALFNSLSERLTVMRDARIIRHPRRRVLEMAFLSLIVSAIFFFSPFYFPCQQCPNASHPNVNIDCSGGDTDSLKKAVQFMCPTSFYSGVATLTFTTEVGTVRHLFSRGSSDEFSMLTLLFFFVTYYALALWATGAAVAGGLLVPLLIVGASYGRLFGSLMVWLGFHIDPGVYALIGAASFFGGVTRMTISLSIIMLEITNDLHYLPAIMLTVMTAKWVGDFFTPPIYEGLMELKCYPFLDQEPPIEMDLLVSSDVMATKVKVVTETPRVKDLLALLRSCEHNGFPVVSAHPLHRPIIQEALNQRVALGVPVGMPEMSLMAERVAVRQSRARQHLVPAPQAAALVHQHTPAPTGTAKEKAATSVAQPQPILNPVSSSQSSPSSATSAAAHSSAKGKNKAQLLTAGVSAALGHGSGRVLRGLVLRKQLLILLQAQVWASSRMIDPLDFRQRMAMVDLKHQAALLDSIERELTIADREAKVDLRPYMNRSPFSVHYDFHSVFCFRLFRSMGLRHLPVVNDANEVVGIITRKDIVHPIVTLKYEALLGCKEDGSIAVPGRDHRPSEDEDDQDDDNSHNPLSPTHGVVPQSRRHRAILQSRRARLRPGLRAYSYLSPVESSPELPGTPVYSTPTLLSRPLIGISPKEAAAHKSSFNWSSRLTTRV